MSSKRSCNNLVARAVVSGIAAGSPDRNDGSTSEVPLPGVSHSYPVTRAFGPLSRDAEPCSGYEGCCVKLLVCFAFVHRSHGSPTHSLQLCEEGNLES